MYLRLKGRRMPTEFMTTASEYLEAPDRSGILIKGTLKGNTLAALPLEVRKNALHIVPNPKLGVAGVQIVTKDDGVVTPQVRLTKDQQELVAELDYHFKIMFQLVSLPWVD